MNQINIDDTVRNLSPNLKIDSLLIRDAVIEDSGNNLRSFIDNELEKISRFFKTREDIYNDEIIIGLRSLYKCWKIDPSRYRPSPERLLRKITGGSSFNFINNIVDLSNIISMKYRIPVSLYDLDKINGELILKKSTNEDKYLGITGMEIGTKDKVLFYDNTGAAGSPTTDSRRTMVTDSTVNLIFIAYGPENVGKGYMENMLEDYSDKVILFNIGKVTKVE